MQINAAVLEIQSLENNEGCTEIILESVNKYRFKKIMTRLPSKNLDEQLCHSDDQNNFAAVYHHLKVENLIFCDC